MSFYAPPPPHCQEMWGADSFRAHNDAAGNGLYKYGVRASLANNRGNDDGRQWAWGVEKAEMILSVTITEQGIVGVAEGGLGVAN